MAEEPKPHVNVPGAAGVGIGGNAERNQITTNLDQSPAGNFYGTVNFNQGGTQSLGQLVETPQRLAHIRLAPLREKFAGRVVLLDELEKKLQPGQGASLSQRAAIHADGGVGKTALVVELAWRLFDQGKFDYVFLLNCHLAGDARRQLGRLVRARPVKPPQAGG
jgi:hypothetical protein